MTVAFQCTAYSGNPLLVRANLLTTDDILSAAGVDFSDDITTKSSNLSEPIDALTADFTSSTWLCARAARSHEADVTGIVSKKTSNA